MDNQRARAVTRIFITTVAWLSIYTLAWLFILDVVPLKVGIGWFVLFMVIGIFSVLPGGRQDAEKENS